MYSHAIPIYGSKDSTAMIKIEIAKLEGLVPRMLELTSRNTPWHRRCWRAGTLEVVEETLRELRIPGTREKALNELRAYMVTALGRDPAVSTEQKEGLKSIVKNIGPNSDETSHDVNVAAYYLQDLRDTYLLNWAHLFRDPTKMGKLDVEGTAKRIVSHLLYCGLPASSVYVVIDSWRSSDDERNFSDLLEELDVKAKTELKHFSFAVPVSRMPAFLRTADRPSEWLTAQQMKRWKHKHAPNEPLLRHQGGFLLTVQARDVNGAAIVAQRQLAQLSFKFQSGSNNHFTILPTMWSQEKGTAFPTRREIQTFKLRAFQRANVLHHLEIGMKVRNILAIVEPLQTQDSHVAIVNGWMAIESLLVDAGEEDWKAAERMAYIVAASYFRAEMTWLARNYSEKYEKQCSTAKLIKDSELSADRIRLMGEVICKEDSFELLDPRDQLAIRKIRETVENPAAAFSRTRDILKREFLRMYRKRNLIVHGGRVLDDGVDSDADKVIPLLIAGIDQLLIANIQYGLDPKALAGAIRFKSRHLVKDGNSKIYSIWGLLDIEGDHGNDVT